MVKTKSVRDKPEKSDGERILVTRYWPRPFSKKQLKISCRLKNLAPGEELLKDWKGGIITWDEYKKRFLKEISQQLETLECVTKKAVRETITLICIEREGNPHCHRPILKELIERELKAGKE